ncbi:MAG: NUDIX hydrolase [Acidobacteriota bacterium]
MTPTPRTLALLETLRLFHPADPQELAALDRIRAFLLRAPDPFARATPEGHITASVVILRPDAGASAFLLVRHRKLDRWLQPGGHSDPTDETTLATALREAREETGLGDLTPRLGGGPLDFDVHEIPARPGEPAHLHYDIRYLATSPGEAATGDALEVSGLGWFSLADALALGVDPSLGRALRKAAALAPSGR